MYISWQQIHKISKLQSELWKAPLRRVAFRCYIFSELWKAPLRRVAFRFYFFSELWKAPLRWVAFRCYIFSELWKAPLRRVAFRCYFFSELWKAQVVDIVSNHKSLTSVSSISESHRDGISDKALNQLSLCKEKCPNSSGSI